MKYIILICSLFIITSGTAVYVLYFTGDEVDKDNFAIRINDRIISKDELLQKYSFRSSHVHDYNDFIQSVISKELFIQEAKKLKIDQEDKFRQAIQNYYEQSLIRILMDRKMESLVIETNDGIVDRYISLLDKSVNFTLWTIESKNIDKHSLDVTLLGQGTTQEAAFRDLSIELRCILSKLKENELSPPSLTKTDLFTSRYIVIRLNRILPTDKSSKRIPVNREKIQIILKDYEKQNALNNWAEGLKGSADIGLMIDVTNPDFIEQNK
jgi:hypothetical protein